MTYRSLARSVTISTPALLRMAPWLDSFSSEPSSMASPKAAASRVWVLASRYGIPKLACLATRRDMTGGCGIPSRASAVGSRVRSAQPRGDRVAHHDRGAELFDAGSRAWARLGDCQRGDTDYFYRRLERSRLLHRAVRSGPCHRVRRLARVELRIRSGTCVAHHRQELMHGSTLLRGECHIGPVGMNPLLRSAERIDGLKERRRKQTP
jgi:hypothetical protein